MKFVTDTGCPVTIISEQTRAKIGARVNVNSTQNKIITANGSTSKISGNAKIKLRVHNWEVEMEVMVVENLMKDCLLGLDVLESCPITSTPMRNLREALSLDAEIGQKSRAAAKKRWYEVAESPAREFFEGIQEQVDKAKRLEEQEEKSFEGIPIRFCGIERIHKAELDGKIAGIEAEMSSLRSEMKAICNYVEVNHIFLEEKETKSEFHDEKRIDELREEALRYVKEICSDGLKGLKVTSDITHVIELTDNKPFREKYRAVPHAKRAEFKVLIDGLLEEGFIRPSKSPYASPVNLVKKSDGSIRLTIDYKKLNAITIKDNYPLPIIDDLFMDLLEASIMSKLDAESGYYQIAMDEESRKFTAFGCEFGLFEWTRMPMGLKNAGATFQRAMDKLLKSGIRKFCHVYMDDVIIFSRTPEEHLIHLKMVVDMLRKAEMKIKLKKCQFFLREIEFLGNTISGGKIRPNKGKIEALMRYPRPMTLKQLFSFLGLASYYRKFIENFTKLAHALYECCEANKNNKRSLMWTAECQKSFDTLRTCLTDESKVLLIPDLAKPFKLFTDACEYGIGAVLSQEETKSKKWRPVSYFSKHLSKTERNYSTAERELLAIVRGVEHNRQFLYGTRFTVVTDHQPLQWLMSHKNPAARLARWIIRLEQYEFKIEYRKGSAHGNADAMSRWPLKDADEEGEGDFNDVHVNAVFYLDSEDQMIRVHVKKKAEDPRMSINVQAIFFRQITGCEEQEADEEIQWIKRSLLECETRPKGPKKLTREQAVYNREWYNFAVFDDTLWRKATDKSGNKFTQYVVPKNQRELVMEQLHGSVLSGHLMFDKTFERARSRYFWPFMRKEIAKYVESCDACQRATGTYCRQRAALQPMIVDRPLQLVTTDCLGPLKESRSGNTNISVVADSKTKYAWFRATANQKAKVICPMLVRIMCEFGLFESLLTDQGKNYESELLAELCELLDIRKVRTTPYHPEADGLSERLNRSLIKMVKTYINEDHEDWDEKLPQLEFAYNSSVHASTGFTPFELMFGRKAKIPLDLILSRPEIDFPVSTENYAAEVKRNLNKAYEAVRENVETRMETARLYYNRVHIACDFEVGDKVLVRVHKKEPNACWKFTNKWRGPYTVEAVANRVDYELRPVKTRARKILMHRNNLKRYVEREGIGTRPTAIGDTQESNGNKVDGEAEAAESTVGKRKSMNTGTKRARGRPPKRLVRTEQESAEDDSEESESEEEADKSPEESRRAPIANPLRTRVRLPRKAKGDRD